MFDLENSALSVDVLGSHTRNRKSSANLTGLSTFNEEASLETVTLARIDPTTGGTYSKDLPARILLS